MAIICFLTQQDGARISSHYNRTTVGRDCSKLRRTLVSLQQCTRKHNWEAASRKRVLYTNPRGAVVLCFYTLS